ncbi:MAG: AIR synthase family protein, partial [Thermaerobacterales bacterium]
LTRPRFFYFQPRNGKGRVWTVTDFPQLGKIDGAFFRERIQPFLGAARHDVLVGPVPGVDVGVIDLGHGRVMIVSNDPLSVLPEIGWEASAWLAVHLLASDVATSGLSPTHLSVTFNLPPETTEDQFQRYWQSLHQACADLGVAVVAGHTARYEGCGFTIIGAGTMLAVGPEDRYVTSAMARPGDRIVMTKSAALESAAVLARVFPETVRAQAGREAAAAAAELLYSVSTVADAKVAAAFGLHGEGVTAMHDVTEGGILGSVLELADAAGSGLIVDRDRIPVWKSVAAVCRVFGLDPLYSLGEGALLLTVRPERAAALIATLARAGISAATIGELRPAAAGRRLRGRGSETALTAGVDPYWQAYARAQRECLK